MCGATVDFVDIDPNTHNMCVTALERKLEEAAVIGCLPKIVMPVHFAGLPCDMLAISKLSKKFNFFIVEDASHALGSCSNKTRVGKCEFSDVTVFSFHPVKSITCGEGGAVLTNCANIDRRVRLLRSHGISRNVADATGRPWEYSQTVLGYNYRMSDIEAALGVSQLKKLDLFVKKRNLLAERYISKLGKENCLKLGTVPKDTLSAYHLFVIELVDELKDKRDLLYSLMVDSDITPGIHYIPVHTQAFYKNLGFKNGDFPIAENYYHRCLSLPLHPGLTLLEQDQIINILITNIEYLRIKS
jgi:dTDP-4-amino-4,6-dideoxygalactose transaminase